MEIYCWLNMIAFILSVDGTWRVWTSWTDCSVTCGGGKRSRSRTCSDPKYGGKHCVGIANEEQACKSNNCPGKFESSYNYVYNYTHM